MKNISETDGMHILFLPRWYPNRYDPMFGLFVKRHAEAVSLLNKVSVVYVTEATDAQSALYDIEHFADQNLFTTIVYYQKSDLRPVLFAKAINIFRFYRANFHGIKLNTKKFGKIHLIHIHILTRLALIAIYFKWMKGTSYIITEHWSRYLQLTNGFTGFWRKIVTKLAVRGASTITTVTQNLAEAMQNHGLKNPNYVVLPNVVDVNLFKIQHQKANPIFRFVHISCFEDRSKNITGLVNALRKLSVLRNDFECILVGDGIDYQKIKNGAIDLESFGLIHFRGLLQNDLLADELSKSDCLLLFSNYENMPVVILEAFACGLPVIATRVGGIPEMVNPQNGSLVDAGDEAGFVEAMVKMIDSQSQYKADEIRSTVTSTNSYEAVSVFLDGLYRKYFYKKLETKSNPK